ncbi:MAG: hypothetical protein HFI86_00545 [Bacilli bacterium]|nr:hypothetical protein [Bacilli bacterium]
MKKLNLNKIDIFRIVILVILSAFLIFNIIKLFTNSTKKEKMSEEYFLDLIKENKLEYIDRNNSSIDNINELPNNFKLQLALNSIESTTEEDVKNYLINIFGSDIDIEFTDITDGDTIVYKYEDHKFNLNSEYNNKNFVVSDYIDIVDFKDNDNTYELTITKIFYNMQDGNLKNGFFGSYENALLSKNNDYNLDNSIFTLELTENLEENKKLLEAYYNEHKNELKEKLTEYKYTFKKQEEKYILIKYEIIK